MKRAKETLNIEIDNEKVKKVVLYLLSFLVPLIALIGIFMRMKVYPFGENMYLPVDAYGQYVNYLQYFREVFLGDNSIIYSLGKSIGGEMLGLFAYYLMSPYNFITLFFRKGNISLAFDIILILKIASTSVGFTYYLNRRKKANFANLIFAFMYSLSSYVITYGYNIMWLDAVILLPIVIAGLDDILDKKSNCLYIIVLSITLITNYYIGFMVCVFSVIYFIYKILLGDLKDKKDIIRKTRKFIIYSICAGLISAIVLVPVFIGLQDGRASFSFKEMTFQNNFGMKEFIGKFFTNSFNFEEIKNHAMPPVFCGVLANILVISYFFNKKIKLKEQLLSMFMIIVFIASFYIRAANLIWSMGNPPAWWIYRYAFCFIFMYIIFAKRRI